MTTLITAAKEAISPFFPSSQFRIFLEVPENTIPFTRTSTHQSEHGIFVFYQLPGTVT